MKHRPGHPEQHLQRFQRQVVFGPLGLEGQRRLAKASALIIGVGGLGTWIAELLTRGGVGHLRLVDDDYVEICNIHRQSLYDEQDAMDGGPKVRAAADRLRRINSQAQIEPVEVKATHENIETLAGDMQILLDGTDNFATRFVINDLAVKTRRPWVFSGVIECQAQVMNVIPGQTPCLRCIMDAPPPACQDRSCRNVGVLGPAVATAAAMAAGEAMKILSGHAEMTSPHLLKYDMWANTMQRIDLTGQRRGDCVCCGLGEFEYLEP